MIHFSSKMAILQVKSRAAGNASVIGGVAQASLPADKMSALRFPPKTEALLRQHLNRKLKGVLGVSANQFITTLRLKRAAHLLEQRSATVTEIAYAAGFNNPAYFAECFRKQFGCSPSEVLGKPARSER